MKKELLHEVEIPKLIIKEGRALIYLNYKEIKWIKTDGNYASIFLQDNKKIVSRISMLELQQLLPAQLFIRIHKSYMINKRYVTKIMASRIFIDVQHLPVGRSYQQSVITFFTADR
jgi:two-component system LytT family response regulator